jgi:hypothetical protein
MKTTLHYLPRLGLLLAFAKLAHSDAIDPGRGWDSLLPEPTRISARAISLLEVPSISSVAPIHVVSRVDPAPYLTEENAKRLAEEFGISKQSANEYDDDGFLATRMTTADQERALILSPLRWRIILRQSITGREIVEADDSVRLSKSLLGIVECLGIPRSDIVQDALLQPAISIKASRSRSQYGPARPTTLSVSLSRRLGDIPILGTPLVFAGMFPNSGTESIIFNWKPWKEWRNLELLSLSELLASTRDEVYLYGARPPGSTYEKIEVISARVVYMDDGISSQNNVLFPIYELKIRYVHSIGETNSSIQYPEFDTVFAGAAQERLLADLYNEAFAAASQLKHQEQLPGEPLERESVPSLSR